MVFHKDADTIAAKATPQGVGGVGVIRVSGNLAHKIAKQIAGKELTPRFAHYLPFVNQQNEMLDKGVALFFKGPNSFTGEDVLELQGHGGPVVMDQILNVILNLGARLARPGEFLERAFLNNKIDLCQAEATHDLINAASCEAAKSAIRSLQGVFSDKINLLIQEIIALRMFVEAAIDFPDEEIDLLQENEIKQRLHVLIQKINDIKKEAVTGRLLTEGVKTVLIGRPNAGKSSLLNVLSGNEAAIVTDIPGTTRDILREEVNVEGLRIQFVDTAGIRDPGDAIEQQGIDRAFKEIQLADHILLIVDASVTNETDPKILFPELAEFFGQIPMTVVRNKMDIVESMVESTEIETKTETGTETRTNAKTDADTNRTNRTNKNFHQYSIIPISAKTKLGIQDLHQHLKTVFGMSTATEGNFAARRRHLHALEEALQYLNSAENELNNHLRIELLAENLKWAQASLDQITGRLSSDDLLGKIFSEFCIGK